MIRTTWSCLVAIVAVLFLAAGTALSAAKKPATLAELAVYTGPDRQQILEEGAKKEGKLTFYTSGIITQGVGAVVDSFQKEYPYIKVEVWRAGSDQLVPRILEEFKAGKLLADVVENSQTGHMVLQQYGGIFQPFYSPELASVAEGAITRAPGGGAVRVGFRESGHSVGYNTKLLSKEQLPKTFQDFLDPKWRPKVAIAADQNGVYWAGTMREAYGEDFVKKLAAQNFAIHPVSARAVLDMLINGEYALSPTINEAHVQESKKKGAPVDWVPLEPVHVNLGQIALCKPAPHPYSALLFIDHQLSKETGAMLNGKGYLSTRKDVIGTKSYRKNYGPETIEEGKQWNELFKQLFLKK